ncbi:MAG: MraZ protein, partial [Flavobacteriaceae bacterium]
NDFIRRFSAGVKTVELDVTGRLLIPKDLFSFAGIEKEIVISSAINIVEIWDKNKYEQAINDAANDFADLAEEVMGDDSDVGNGIS